MQQIADQIDTITGLRVRGYPADSITPPSALVTYPETYTYDATYGRGMDRIEELPVAVLVGKVADRSTRDRITQYVNGSGPASIKAVIESGTYTAFHTVRVTGVTFDVVTIAAVDYLGATFTLDITGAGA